MTSLNAAIAGTGFMGSVHAEALRRIGVNVVGMLGSTPEKSRTAARQLGIRRAYDSYEQLLADSEVQAVHICTPNRWHFEMARLALQHDKHVLCEKPLAMASRESGELAQLAAQRPQLAAAVNYNMRFYPLCQEARERVLSGAVGDVFHVQGGYVQDWLLRATDYNWRVLDAEGGTLRAVSDIGTHWLDLIQNVLGLKVEAVLADLKTVHPQRFRPRGEVATFSREQSTETEPVEIRTDDYGAILLRFEQGVRGSLVVSQVTAGRKNCLRFEIAGSACSLAFDSESPNQLWVGHRDVANELLLKDPGLLSPAARRYADYPGGHNEGYDDSFKQCFKAFYQYIEAADWNAPVPFPSFAEGHREMLLCDAIARSHQQQRWVDVS